MNLTIILSLLFLPFVLVPMVLLTDHRLGS